MLRYTINKNLTTIYNMIISTFGAVVLGILLRILGLPCWLVCGSVAVCAVVFEHFLTIYPLAILKYFKLPEKTNEEK